MDFVVVLVIFYDILMFLEQVAFYLWQEYDRIYF